METDKKFYYISTGEDQKMFTLRQVIFYDHYNSRGQKTTRQHDEYLCNLATDLERAKAKAREKIDDDAPLKIGATHVGDIDYSGNGAQPKKMLNRNNMPFGKYQGVHFRKVLNEDPDYLAWFCEEFAHKSNGQKQHDWKMFIISQSMQALHESGAMVEGVSRSTYEYEQRKKKQQQARQQSTHIGQQGDKLEDVEAKVVFRTTFETRYGLKQLFKLRTRDGNTIAWFTTSHTLDELAHWLTPYEETTTANCAGNDDVWFRFSATVKEHDDYKGEKQTIVKRLNVSDVLFRGYELNVANCDKWEKFYK